MDKKRRRVKKGWAQKIMIVIAVVIVILVIVVRILQGKISDKYGKSDGSEIKSAQVTVGSVNTTVSGSGILAEEGIEDLDIPVAVEIEEVKVKAGDTVEQGDILATVNRSSVVLAMSNLQTEMEEKDEEISDSDDDSVSSSIKTKLAGRVKEVYVESGDSVASAMYDNSALMLLSLDGYMAVDIETDKLKTDDEVVVKEGDTEYEGTVSEVQNGIAVVLITDNGPKNKAKVSVSKDESKIGEGELYIHEELKITGYTGTVSSVKADVDSKVSSGSTLITLSDTGFCADYETLLKERSEMEEIMNKLVAIYQDNGITAPISGTISSINDETSKTSAVEQTGQSNSSEDLDVTEEVTLLSISPNETMIVGVSIDESDILAMEVGQEAYLTIDSIGEDTYEGTVTEIGAEGTSSGGVTTYEVSIRLDKTEDMRAGMSVSAAIKIEGVEGALLVPEEAVTKTRSSTYVYTSADESSGELSDMVEVSTGISGNGYIEITEGLGEGDTVYYKEETSSSEFSMPGNRGDKMNNMQNPGGGFDGQRGDFTPPSGGMGNNNSSNKGGN